MSRPLMAIFTLHIAPNEIDSDVETVSIVHANKKPAPSEESGRERHLAEFEQFVRANMSYLWMLAFRSEVDMNRSVDLVSDVLEDLFRAWD